MISSHTGRRAGGALLGLLVLLAGLAAAPAAHAHDVLVASDPEEGAVLQETPEAVVLTFNNSPLEVGSAISVVDAAGETVTEGEGTVEGTDVVLPLDADLPAGELEIHWRVASSDGHPIDGVIGFTVEDAAPDPTETGDAPAATEAGDAPTTPQSAPAATADDDPDSGSQTPQEDEATGGLAGLPTWAQVIVGLAAIGAVAGLIVLVVRRLRDDRV